MDSDEGFVEVRDPQTGKLLFRFDPGRDLIEVKQKNGFPVKVSLTEYRAAEKPKQ